MVRQRGRGSARQRSPLDATGGKCQAQVCWQASLWLIRASLVSRKRAAFAPRRLSRTSSKEIVMSVYRVTEIIGTSATSWEDAAAEAIRTAAATIRDLRVAEVVKQDIHLNEDGAITYRTKLQLSFKYETGH